MVGWIMDDYLDLTIILKYCPQGWKFYSTRFGDVEFFKASDTRVMFLLDEQTLNAFVVECDGSLVGSPNECIVFPSSEQQDWSKFEAPWYKQNKQRGKLFDPHTFQLLEKVLVRDEVGLTWKIDLFSNLSNYDYYPYVCVGGNYNFCIPYNEDTKHLLGSDEDEPEYYRFAREWQKNKQN